MTITTKTAVPDPPLPTPGSDASLQSRSHDAVDFSSCNCTSHWVRAIWRHAAPPIWLWHFAAVSVASWMIVHRLVPGAGVGWFLVRHGSMLDAVHFW